MIITLPRFVKITWFSADEIVHELRRNQNPLLICGIFLMNSHSQVQIQHQT